MQLHNLLYDNDLKCLYCQGKCTAITMGYGYPTLVIETYICQECKEGFEAEHIDDYYYGFSFTCNGIKVFHNYEDNLFGLSKTDFDSRIRNNLTWVPYFKFSFSKKEELFQKLRIYIIFG